MKSLRRRPRNHRLLPVVSEVRRYDPISVRIGPNERLRKGAKRPQKKVSYWSFTATRWPLLVTTWNSTAIAAKKLRWSATTMAAANPLASFPADIAWIPFDAGKAVQRGRPGGPSVHVPESLQDLSQQGEIRGLRRVPLGLHRVSSGLPRGPGGGRPRPLSQQRDQSGTVSRTVRHSHQGGAPEQ